MPDTSPPLSEPLLQEISHRACCGRLLVGLGFALLLSALLYIRRGSGDQRAAEPAISLRSAETAITSEGGHLRRVRGNEKQTADTGSNGDQASEKSGEQQGEDLEGRDEGTQEESADSWASPRVGLESEGPPQSPDPTGNGRKCRRICAGAALPTKNASSHANTGHEFLHTSCERIFDFLAGEDGFVDKAYFVKELSRRGIRSDDPRFAEIMSRLAETECVKMDQETFIGVICENIIILQKILADEAVIPHFEDFAKDIREIYAACKDNRDGNMADYIPYLSRQNPEHWAVSVCTIHGQRTHVGDAEVTFPIQSCSKPITYGLALQEHGQEKVHQHVGREPSGEEFNALKLNKQGRPHNPMINSGAIMTCSLIKKGMDPGERFQYVSEQWAKLAGGKKPGFSNTVYLSERGTADRNFALAYFMNENGAFPEGTNLLAVLEFYFQCCSLTMTSDQLSIVAATLANGGVNPLTGEQIFHSKTVRNCLSMMYSCGMYDYSGEFAFRMGLPGKSGVAGAAFVVIPNVMGICTFSPNLDKYGNSVRGIEFYKLLTQRFSFHNFEMLTQTLHGKKDPSSQVRGTNTTEQIIKDASWGDISALKRLRLKSVDLNIRNYDYRTPLHLAASHGHLNVVQYLCESGGVKDVNPLDRWGGTPWDDAMVEGFVEVAHYLETRGGKGGPRERLKNTKGDGSFELTSQNEHAPGI